MASSAPTLAGNVYAVSARLWRADRYGTRIEQVPIDVPVQGTIEYNEDTEAKHKLSLEVNRPGYLRPFVDYLIPELTLVGLDGVPQTAALGHYIVTPPKTRLTASRFSGTIEGRSIVWLLASDTLGDGLTIPAGTDKGAAARDIALGAGLLASQLALPDTGDVLAEDWPVDPGTTRLTAINDLYNSANWYAVWADGQGVVRTSPWQDLDTARETHRYGAADELAIIGELDEEPEWGRLRNRVTVRNIAPGREPIHSTREVQNRASPMHRDNLGLVLAGAPVDDPQIETQAQADARAETLLADGASYYRKARVSTVLDLSAGAHDVVRLDLTHAGARYDGLWVRRAWKVRLGGVTAVTESDLYRIERWRA